MALSGTTSRGGTHRVLQQRADGSAARHTLIVVSAAAIVLSLACSSPRAGTDESWVGRRVVPKMSNITDLQGQRATVHRNDPALIYRVERVDGPRLWVKAEGENSQVWFLAAEVVPVEQAAEFFTARIRANPNDAFAFLVRATLWSDADQFDKAIADYAAAIKIDPGDAYAYQRRGEAFRNIKEYDKAIADLDEAIRLGDRSEMVYYNRGEAFLDVGDCDKAIADFTHVIELDSKDACAYRNSGWARVHTTEFDHAVTDFDAAITLDPKASAAISAAR